MNHIQKDKAFQSDNLIYVRTICIIPIIWK